MFDSFLIWLDKILPDPKSMNGNIIKRGWRAKAHIKERDAKCQRIMAECFECSKKESRNKEFFGCSNFKLDNVCEMCANFETIERG